MAYYALGSTVASVNLPKIGLKFTKISTFFDFFAKIHTFSKTPPRPLRVSAVVMLSAKRVFGRIYKKCPPDTNVFGAKENGIWGVPLPPWSLPASPGNQNRYFLKGILMKIDTFFPSGRSRPAWAIKTVTF